jgi:hypothetical protein
MSHVTLPRNSKSPRCYISCLKWTEVTFQMVPACRNVKSVPLSFVAHIITHMAHMSQEDLTCCLMSYVFFFFYNLNQQSEFTFYKLMLWLQCLDGESSSGESPVTQIRSIGQFLLSRLFSVLNSSVLRSGISWVPSLVWWLLHFWWMTSCTYDMPLRILDWLLWIIDMLDLLAQPHNSRPYVQIGMIMVL